MKTIKHSIMVALMLTAPSVLHADDVKLDKLPAAVQKAIKQLAKGGEVEEIEVEKDDKGQTFYEVEIEKADDSEIEVTINAAGEVVELEEEIAVKKVPQMVIDAIAKKYPKGEIEEAKKITAGNTVSYELEVEVGEKEYEILATANGKLTVEEEDDEGNDEDGDDEDDN